MPSSCPQPLSEDELRDLVGAAIVETGASSPADLGKVMGKVAPQIKGRADGKARVRDGASAARRLTRCSSRAPWRRPRGAVGEGHGPAP